MDESYYYEPPSNKVFEEVQKAVANIRGRRPFSEEKVKNINDATNIDGSFMWFVAQLDMGNQRILSDMLSEEARTAIRHRYKAGGQPTKYNPFY